MSATFLIPLAGVPETFSTTLAGVTYDFSIIWRDDPGGQGGWVLDIADANSNPILQGIPLITGADLFEQYGYLDFGGSLYMQTAQDPGAAPTFENLGTDCNMYFVTP